MNKSTLAILTLALPVAAEIFILLLKQNPKKFNSKRRINYGKCNYRR
jgi:hypothetical protein